MIHKAAIEWVMTRVPDAVNNHYAKASERVVIKGRVPDVIVKDKDGRIIEIYEVEVVGKDALPKRKGLRRTLVIALEDGDWDNVTLLAESKDHTLRKMSLRHRGLEALDQKIKIQRCRLKGYNKKIGRRLAMAREKRRVDDGWE